jgi:pimeloyl-ACP methyl ester carboxylesterase
MQPILLCLHGWGGSKESFTELRAALKNDAITVLAPDLPGFGDEPEPSRPWTTDDYADWVITWLNDQTQGNIPALLVLGHSHGGRIAIKLTAGNRLPIDHLFLCAAAGIRHMRHFKRIIGLMLAKTGKGLLSIPGMCALQPAGKKLLYSLIRVHDYEKASPLMRKTLINVTEEDLRPLLSAIHVPTDIFWGTEDGMTPVSDGRIMAKNIPDSHLHLFQGIRHRVHRERAAEIATVIRTVCGHKKAQ